MKSGYTWLTITKYVGSWIREHKEKSSLTRFSVSYAAYGNAIQRYITRSAKISGPLPTTTYNTIELISDSFQWVGVLLSLRSYQLVISKSVGKWVQYFVDRVSSDQNRYLWGTIRT